MFASAVTAWEIATKVHLGRLRWDVPTSVESYCLEQRFDLMAITFPHSERAGAWPQEHGDPFDRMLAAQSSLEDIPLATNDRMIKAFGVATIW